MRQKRPALNAWIHRGRAWLGAWNPCKTRASYGGTVPRETIEERRDGA